MKKKWISMALGFALTLMLPLAAQAAELPADVQYFGNSAYKIYPMSVSWEEAKLYCENLGGHLATITSLEEQLFIDSLNSNSQRLWIGGFRDDAYNWFWVTGEPWGYTRWASGEPNNSRNVVSNENRVAIWPKEWNDLNENNKGEQSGFICEWDLNNQTDAQVPATPQVPTIPVDALYFGSSAYKIFPMSVTWNEAKWYCEYMGGHLATITSAEEQMFIELLNGNSQRLWIGGFRDDAYNWFWVTGEPWVYTHWASGEPNNSRNVVSNENRAAVWPKEWNDLNENNKSEQGGFICEWDFAVPAVPYLPY